MKFCSQARSFAHCAAFAGAVILLCVNASGQFKPRHAAAGREARPAPVERRSPPPAAQERPQQSPERPQPPGGSTLAPIQRHENPSQKGQNGEHLASWLDHHSSLTPAQQQQALDKEPGFHDLPAQTQQRMRDRLTQLNNMSPTQRANIIAHTEAMEKLTPDQRGQVRTAMQQVSTLPPASRRAVERAFRNLRDLPPAEREAYLNSPDIRSQFTDQERGALSGLMGVETYLPRNPTQPSP